MVSKTASIEYLSLGDIVFKTVRRHPAEDETDFSSELYSQGIT